MVRLALPRNALGYLVQLEELRPLAQQLLCGDTLAENFAATSVAFPELRGLGYSDTHAVWDLEDKIARILGSGAPPAISSPEPTVAEAARLANLAGLIRVRRDYEGRGKSREVLAFEARGGTFGDGIGTYLVDEAGTWCVPEGGWNPRKCLDQALRLVMHGHRRGLFLEIRSLGGGGVEVAAMKGGHAMRPAETTRVREGDLQTALCEAAAAWLRYKSVDR